MMLNICSALTLILNVRMRMQHIGMEVLLASQVELLLQSLTLVVHLKVYEIPR